MRQIRMQRCRYAGGIEPVDVAIDSILLVLDSLSFSFAARRILFFFDFFHSRPFQAEKAEGSLTRLVLKLKVILSPTVPFKTRRRVMQGYGLLDWY